MRLKRETQGAFCVLNANAKSQTRKSMKINMICTVGIVGVKMYVCTLSTMLNSMYIILAILDLVLSVHA